MENTKIISKVSCSLEDTDKILEYGNINKYDNNIPKIIHYHYKTSFIPIQLTPLVKQCLKINTDVKFVFWTDFTSYQFVLQHFPNYTAMFSSYFHKSSEYLKRSDVIRYFILAKFGGIYMDMDTKCQKKFDKGFRNNSCILSKEVEEHTRIYFNRPYIAMNSLMACVPQHDFFKYIIDNLSHSSSQNILEQTGPMMLTDMYNLYIKSGKSKNDSRKLITLADPYMFSPHLENALEGECLKKPHGYWKKKGCESLPKHRLLQKIKIDDAIVNHLFMHLGYDDYKHLITNVENACISLKNLTLFVQM